MGKADFSHLSGLEVSKDSTAELTLHSIAVNGVSPTLILAPATEANPPYFNALLKRVSRSARQVRSGNVNTSLIEKNRDEDRELYPEHVVKGWYDMLDAEGEAVKFTKSNAADFFAALPGWVFDIVRDFCGSTENYSGIIDVQVAAKK